MTAAIVYFHVPSANTEGGGGVNDGLTPPGGDEGVLASHLRRFHVGHLYIQSVCRTHLLKDVQFCCFFWFHW